MIPKEADWLIISQCDAQAVKLTVETSERPACTIVTPMRTRSFEQKLTEDALWKQTFDVLCSSYRDLGDMFAIVPDDFGGYKLLYTGTEVVLPPHVFRRCPVGFLKSIPDGISDLSVMRSERTGCQLLLLGPVRFINSHCDPNCEYDFSSDLGIVQIRVKKKLKPRDEITVKYGDDFFYSNQCLCSLCLRERNENADEIFCSLLKDVIVELAEESHTDISTERKFLPRKRVRISRREKIEAYEKACNLTSFSSILPDPVNRDLSASICSTSEQPDATNVSHLATDESCVDDSASNSILLAQPRASSPVFRHIPNQLPSFEDFEAECEIQENAPVEKEKKMSRTLFEGSEVSEDDAKILTELFCTRFALSDVASISLHSLIGALLPAENSFPTGYSYVSKVKKNLQQSIRFSSVNESRAVCILNFREQLNSIVDRNLIQMLDYGVHREEHPNEDINPAFSEPFTIEGNSVTCNLLLSVDGVNIKKSTIKKEVWPIWLQVADLPPILRMARKNIVLAGLFVGAGAPDWETFLPHLSAELSGAVHCSRLQLVVSYKVRLLVADLIAKFHVLNMYKFNGFHGCHFCTAEGKTIGRTHAYYPFDQKFEIRTNEMHEEHVIVAESLKEISNRGYVGVKGRSAFSCLVDDLPLSAPLDYMHCVLLGVFPEILRRLHKALTPHFRAEINLVVANLSCPREMTAYARAIRSLDEMPHFKANEFFNWLFYVSPILMRDRVDIKLYKQLLNFTCAIRLLLESSNEESVSYADKLLTTFCRNVVAFFEGDEKIETINVHSLRHLPHQVRKFGPLFSCSAMSFEAANRVLGDLFTGSVNECDVISRRVLQKYSLCNSELQNKQLKGLFDSLMSGTIPDNPENFDKEMNENDALLRGKQLYPEARFLNRHKIKREFFDSLSYQRSNGGNCFVQFEHFEETVFGQILYFVDFPGESVPLCAAIKIYRIVEEFGPVTGLYYRVIETNSEDLKPVYDLKKVFCLYDEPKKENYIATLCTVFDHS